MNFESVFRDSKVILTEGAIVERLRHERNVSLDEHINHAGLIYDAPGVMATLYEQYVEIARKYRLPIMLMTPTRRVNFETLQQSAFRDKDVIADCCAFLNSIRDRYQHFAGQIFIGGLLGCKGDAYRAEEPLSRSEAYKFHKPQVTRFTGKNLDFLFAGIMPAITEALGMAEAMAESQIPYIISFMVRKDGRLLDGTSIADAIQIIDDAITPPPVCYMSNCVHPTNLKMALSNPINCGSRHLARFMGIQANASALSPEQLDQCGTLHQEDFDEMVREMNCLRKEFGFKIFGGCCGTDDGFIDKLGRGLMTSTHMLTS